MIGPITYREVSELINSLSTPHALLNDSSLTPQRPFITKRIKVSLDFPAILSMDKVDVDVYIFPPFFETVDRMCIGILFRSEGIFHKTECDVIQHGQPDMGVLRHG